MLRTLLLIAAAARATTTTTTTTDGPHDGRTDGPTPSKALTAPATSAAVSAGPPRTDVAPPGRTRVRMVVSGRDRHTQFCIGELVFLDSAGRDVAASKASASAPRAQKGFEPKLLSDGRLHHDFCSAEPTGWVSLDLEVPLRELAAYRIGSDCGEDTPTDWTLEACDSCVHSDQEKWETLDVRTSEPWRGGCDGEWRDYSIQRWRVLRISSGVQDWCLDALRLNGEENKPLRINSARPVAAPGATEASGARDFAQRASTISRLVGIGGPPSDNGQPWCGTVTICVEINH